MAMGRRLAAGVVALAATFGLLTAGAAVMHEATITSPVARAMRLGAVQGYRLDTAAPTPTVSVRLRGGVDLQAVCEALDARLAPVFGQAPALEVAGPGQAGMRALLEQAAVPVAQGIATGQFVTMSSTVERLAQKTGAAARVEVDASAVYVTLRRKDGGDAYAVFARTPSSALAPGASS